MIDPFTQTYKYIFDALKNNSVLLGTVKPNSFIDLTEGDRLPKNRNFLSGGDYPYIVLYPDSDDEQFPTATSSSSELVQSFRLVGITSQNAISDATGSLKYILPLKFALLQALQPVIAGTPGTEDLPFQVNVRLETVTDSETVEENRGTQGFSVEILLQATIHIDREQMGEFR